MDSSFGICKMSISLLVSNTKRQYNRHVYSKDHKPLEDSFLGAMAVARFPRWT